MCRYRVFLMVVMLTATSMRCTAQEVASAHFTTAEGLPSNTIYDIYKDSRGFLWIGTDKGVAVYNGQQFRIYNRHDGLPDNTIFYFKEDHDHRIWMSSFNGRLCFYKDGILHTENNTPFLKLPFESSNIQFILVEKDSSITVSFQDAARIVNIKHEMVKVYELGPILGYTVYRRIISAEKLSSFAFKLFCNDKIIVIDTALHVLSSRSYQNSNEYLCSIGQDSQYLFNSKGIYSLDEKLLWSLRDNFYKDKIDGSESAINFQSNSIFRIYQKNGVFFISTQNGLLIGASRQLFADDNISATAQAEDGSYWIGTLNNGIHTLSKDFSDTRLLPNVYSGRVQYASGNGRNLFFCTSGSTLYRLKQDSIQCPFDYSKQIPAPQKAIQTAVLLDKDSIFYLFRNNEALLIDHIYRKQARVKTRVTTDFNSSTKRIISQKGLLYMDCGMYITSVLTDSLKKGSFRARSVTRITDGRVFFSASDPHGDVWCSTINSVYKLVDNNPVVQSGFSGISFQWFGFYGGYLIGCTHKNTLLLCNIKGRDVFTDSIKGQRCFWERAFPLDEQRVLICTDKDYRVLTLYPSATSPSFSMQTVGDPLIPLKSEYVYSNGREVTFFKDGSIYTFGLSRLLQTVQPPRVYFTNIQATKDIVPAQLEISLSYNESRHVIISFEGLSFGMGGTEYEYSISTDIVKQWQTLAGEKIDLVAPGYGSYLVSLRAKTGAGTIGPPAMMRLIILRPYWATLWFQLACLSLALGAIALTGYFLLKRNIRKKEVANEQRIRFLKAEYKALNALMNPHFIFNSLNSIQGLINRNDKLSANHYLDVFSKLVRQNMQHVSSELISLQKEMELVTNYLLLEKLRFDNRLNYQINIDKDLELELIMIPPLLVQPLVENAIKHGLLPLQSEKNMLTLNISETGKGVEIEVADNGVGYDPGAGVASDGRHSFALNNIKDRIRQLSEIHARNISFSIQAIIGEGKKPAGTRAILTLEAEPVARGQAIQ
jgi:hypothetical protein